MTDPREIEALCADADAHTVSASGRYCATCYNSWPCDPVRFATTLRALVAENAELRARAMGWESHASQVVEDSKALAAQLAAARKERAFLAEHFWRIRRAACGWDAATGHVTAWEFVAENFEPRRSTVSFCDIFSTFDEALAHLMAQVAAIDAAKGGA